MMMKYFQAPWLISLLIAVITIIWVKWELGSLRTLGQPPADAPEEQPDTSDDKPPETSPTKETGNPQAQPEAGAQPMPMPPNLQPREPIRWEEGLPPPMPFTGGFTQVSEVDQPLDIEDGAFQQTE